MIQSNLVELFRQAAASANQRQVNTHSRKTTLRCELCNSTVVTFQRCTILFCDPSCIRSAPETQILSSFTHRPSLQSLEADHLNPTFFEKGSSSRDLCRSSGEEVAFETVSDGDDRRRTRAHVHHFEQATQLPTTTQMSTLQP